MNLALITTIGSSVFSIVRAIQEEQATADGATKKEIALIVVKEVYNSSPLALKVPFDDAKKDVEALIESAVSIYKTAQLFGFFKKAK